MIYSVVCYKTCRHLNINKQFSYLYQIDQNYILDVVIDNTRNAIIFFFTVCNK